MHRQDFVRQYSGDKSDLKRPPGLFERLHIDLPLALLLLILAGYGLGILYSASDQALSIVGAALYHGLEIHFSTVTRYWPLVLGVIIVILVLAFPQGIVGWLHQRFGATRGRR